MIASIVASVITGAAPAPTVLIDARIQGVVGMALRAMCFGCVARLLRVCAMAVRSTRDHLQVVKAHTSSIAAEMIDSHIERNWCHLLFINPAMGRDKSLPIPEASVTRSDVASPKPTRICLFDTRLKSCEQRDGDARLISAMPITVLPSPIHGAIISQVRGKTVKKVEAN